ncbi:MAG TPA: hypothetical protein VMO26_10465 [Vicinamibacterales bacterium]|nr:hypothetical protein [Vicinamibacterales bacterium]
MRSWLTALATTAGLMAATVLAVPDIVVNAQKQKQTVVVNLTIDPGAAESPNTVLPDGIASTYIDWRLAGDICVAGESYSQGLASVVMNRRMSEGGPLCGGTDPPNETRTFWLLVEHADACAILGAETDLDGVCMVAALSEDRGLPHVRAETLFKSKVTSTAMTFYFARRDESTADPDDVVAYRLTSDAPAQVITHTSNSKSVFIASGTATLAEHQGNPGGYVAVAWGIPLRLAMRFDRVPVP